MSETTTEAVIESAQAQDTFDVLSFISGTAYPTARVVLFGDIVSAKKLKDISAARIQAELETGEPQDDESVNKQIEELSESVRKSSMIVDLRGMPPGIVREIVETDNEDVSIDNEIVAKTIVRVSNHTGASDDRLWDADAVRELRRYLNEGEFAKLVRAVMEVNFNTAVFDEATDAGFLSRDPDLAS